MSDNDFWNRQALTLGSSQTSANALSSGSLLYIPPAKGSPYGMIQPLSQSVQTGPNPGATAIPGNMAPLPTFGAAAPAPQVAQYPAQQNNSLWGQVGKAAEQVAGAVQRWTGIPPTAPLPPGVPALPGDPYNIAAKHQVEGTYMGLNGKIAHDYDPSYNQYDPVSRQGFDIHEGVHGDQYLGALPHNTSGFFAQFPYHWLNASQLEIPAYQKQIDFYQDYLMTHPTDTPNWGKVLKTQQQMYDSLEDIQKK